MPRRSILVSWEKTSLHLWWWNHHDLIISYTHYYFSTLLHWDSISTWILVITNHFECIVSRLSLIINLMGMRDSWRCGWFTAVLCSLVDWFMFIAEWAVRKQGQIIESGPLGETCLCRVHLLLVFPRCQRVSDFGLSYLHQDVQHWSQPVLDSVL